MEGSGIHLEQKGLAEINDVFTRHAFHLKVTPAKECIVEEGIRKTRRDDPLIEQFLAAIPELCEKHVECGLIWTDKLSPHDGVYKPGVHYTHTSQSSQKSAHGLIEFYKDIMSGTRFAIKVLKEKDAFHAEEIKSRLRLQHENIADVYGVIVQRGTVHILMEHAGTPLVEERKWFADSSDRMLQFGKQAFRALKFLHVKGYVHCDIKPDNLMVVRDGNSFTLKVIDFGTCRRIRDSLPPQAHTTWQYWPPELWNARNRKEPFYAEASMDVYAMSLTLYFVQMGSHLMLKIPREAMVTQPEYVKMMGIPESIPPELRVVMSHCLEVNKVRRCTAEEAAVRLLESDSIYHGGCSSKEKYLANLSSVASGSGACQVPFINSLIEQSGSSKRRLAQVAMRNSKASFHKEVTRGPEAVRFEKKTSKIFQELKRMEAQKPTTSGWAPRPRTVLRSTATDFGESSKVAVPVLSCEMTQHYRSDIQDGTYPYASLLGKLAQEFKTQPAQNPVLCSTLQQVKEIPLAPKEIPESLGLFDKTKSLSSISRQKSRTKVRPKSYDRNPNILKNSIRPKFTTSNNDCKTSSKVPDPTGVVEPKTTKLWPMPHDVSLQEGQDSAISLLNTKEDDMDCFIDVFDPEAFQLDKEDGITDYMFDLVEKQEHEEGPESIRADMDEMSLSGPEGGRREVTRNTEYQEMGTIDKVTFVTSSELVVGSDGKYFVIDLRPIQRVTSNCYLSIKGLQ